MKEKKKEIFNGTNKQTNKPTKKKRKITEKKKYEKLREILE